jgi:hypothetical protein
MWLIEATDNFDEWYDALDDTDRVNVLASLMVLKERGPIPGHMQTLLKTHGESKVKAAPIRVFFAFDPMRRGCIWRN